MSKQPYVNIQKVALQTGIGKNNWLIATITTKSVHTKWYLTLINVKSKLCTLYFSTVNFIEVTFIA